MSCQDYEAQIGDYVDGTMDEAQRASFESHLFTCAPCQAAVVDFTVIRAASLSLDAHVPPPQVWHRIASAVDAEPRPLFAVPGARWWHSFAPAAAMAVLVVALAWTAGQLTPIATERTRLARVSPAAGSELVTLDAEYQQVAQDLTTTIAGLERIAADDSTLDMETRDVLDANLTVLDGAIGESRDALQKEPENDVAQESLFEALRHKVALLQDTIALINEMRKGNQDGAARIVSGLNQ
jgi:hypothetical protein